MATPDELRAPATTPCQSCPYRRDVPSGVWHPSEYAKLPAYDRPTAEQPHEVFCCHQHNGRVCSGWAHTHDMDNNLAMRLAALMGAPEDVVEAVHTYESPVPMFESGAQAAEHGMAEVDHPSRQAVETMRKVQRVQEAAERRSGRDGRRGA